MARRRSRSARSGAALERPEATRDSRFHRSWRSINQAAPDRRCETQEGRCQKEIGCGFGSRLSFLLATDESDDDATTDQVDYERVINARRLSSSDGACRLLRIANSAGDPTRRGTHPRRERGRTSPPIPRASSSHRERAGAPASRRSPRGRNASSREARETLIPRPRMYKK